MGSIKSGALPQREIGIIKSEGAAATRNGQYKSGALPQRGIGILKSEGAAATRNGQYKKRGDRKSVV